MGIVRRSYLELDSALRFKSLRHPNFFPLARPRNILIAGQSLDPGMLLEAESIDFDETLGIGGFIIALYIHRDELLVVKRHWRLTAPDVDGTLEAFQSNNPFHSFLTFVYGRDQEGFKILLRITNLPRLSLRQH